MRKNTSISNIEDRLEELKDVPARNPLKVSSERARFLNEAAIYEQAVSPGNNMRQNGWIFPIRKERLTMNTVVSLILAATLLLGGGATAMAAQEDLPNQPLYPVKLWTENASLALAGEPQEQATLLMYMAHKRVQEMAALVEQGITPPDQVRERLQQHLTQVLQLAAGMDEAARGQILLQLRDQLQEQDRILQQLHMNAETESLLTRTRQMLQIHLQLVDDSLADPQGFQYMLENQMQYGQDEEAVPEPNWQGEPGFHQNVESGKPTKTPGNGTGNQSPGNPNPDKPQNGTGGSDSGNESPGGPSPDSPQGGQGGSGSGGGGGNK